MSDIEAFFQEMFAKCRPLKKGQNASQSANLDAGISRAFGHFRCVKDPLSFHKLSKHFISPRFVRLVGASLGSSKEETLTSFETKDPKKAGSLPEATDPFKAGHNKDVRIKSTANTLKTSTFQAASPLNRTPNGRSIAEGSWLRAFALQSPAQNPSETARVEIEGISEIVHTLASEVRFGKKKVEKSSLQDREEVMDDVYFKMLGELKTMDKWDEQRSQAKATPPTTANTTFVQENREDDSVKEPAPFEEEFFKDMTIDISGNPGDSRSSRKAHQIFGPEGAGQTLSSDQISGGISLNRNLRPETPHGHPNARLDPRQGISEADQAAMNSFASFGTITGPPEVQSQRNGDEFEFKPPQPKQNISETLQSNRQQAHSTHNTAAHPDINGLRTPAYQNGHRHLSGRPSVPQQHQHHGVDQQQQLPPPQPPQSRFGQAPTPFDEDDADGFGGFNAAADSFASKGESAGSGKASLPQPQYNTDGQIHYREQTADVRRHQQQTNSLAEIEFDFSKVKAPKESAHVSRAGNPFDGDDGVEGHHAAAVGGFGFDGYPARPSPGIGTMNAMQAGYSTTDGRLRNGGSGFGGTLIRNPAPELDLLGMDLVVPPSGNTAGSLQHSTMASKAASQTPSNPFEDDADPDAQQLATKQEILQDFCELTQKECLQYFETNDPQRPTFKVKGLVSARGFRRDPKKSDPAFVSTLTEISNSICKPTVGLIQP